MRWPSFLSFEDPEDPLAFGLKPGAPRFDLGLPPDPDWTLAALDVFEEAGWDWVWERARTD